MISAKRRPFFFRTARRTAFCLIAALHIAPLSSRAVRADELDDSDWPRIVPGDVRLYIEFRDLAAAREKFRALGIWDTVRDLREEDARQRKEQAWQPQTEKLLGMDSEAVITELLGRRSAIFAKSAANWDDGLLLVELPEADAVARLLKRWGAVDMPEEASGESGTPVRRYVLGGGLLVAATGRLLAIGPAGDPDGLWLRTAHLMEGRRGPSLAARADFAALRARLSPDPQGFLYAVWDKDDPTAPAACQRLVAGIWMPPDRIVCELRGQLSRPETERTPLDAAVLDDVPVTALAAWACGIDFAALRKSTAPMERREGPSLVEIFQTAFGWVRSGEKALIDALGPQCRVVIGRDPKALVTGFDLPAATLTCGVRDGKTVMAQLDMLLDLLANVVAYLNVAAGEGEAPAEPDQDEAAHAEPSPGHEVAVRREECEGVTLNSVRIGPHLARRVNLDFLKNTELAWALVDDRLLLSTSRGHAEEIIRAGRGKAPGMAKMLGDMTAARVSGNRAIVECFVLRGRAVSAMMNNWLAYLKDHQPETLSADWWKKWAQRRVEERQRFGVTLARNKQRPRSAVVREISVNSPAAEQLVIGDVIIGAGGQPLTRDNPAQEIADRYRARDMAKPFLLRILRGEETMDLMIRVPAMEPPDVTAIDPPTAVRRFSTLIDRVDTVTGVRFQTQPDRLEADIHIKWHGRGR